MASEQTAGERSFTLQLAGGVRADVTLQGPEDLLGHVAQHFRDSREDWRARLEDSPGSGGMVTSQYQRQALDRYPEPLNYLVADLIATNEGHWLTGSQRQTYGAESVRECGLTRNQQWWVNALAAAFSDVEDGQLRPYTTATSNIERWGLQSVDELVLAMQEELAEIASAVTEHSDASEWEDGFVDTDGVQAGARGVELLDEIIKVGFDVRDFLETTYEDAQGDPIPVEDRPCITGNLTDPDAVEAELGDLRALSVQTQLAIDEAREVADD